MQLPQRWGRFFDTRGGELGHPAWNQYWPSALARQGRPPGKGSSPWNQASARPRAGAVSLANPDVLNRRHQIPVGAPTIDLGDALVIPGFVEGHIHLDTSFYGDAWKPHKSCTNGFNVHERVAFQAASRGDHLVLPLRYHLPDSMLQDSIWFPCSPRAVYRCFATMRQAMGFDREDGHTCRPLIFPFAFNPSPAGRTPSHEGRPNVSLRLAIEPLPSTPFS